MVSNSRTPVCCSDTSDRAERALAHRGPQQHRRPGLVVQGPSHARPTARASYWALAAFFSSSPTVRPGKPATSKYGTELTSYRISTVLSPFATGERTVCAVTVGTDPLGSASLTTRPSNGPLLGMDRPSTCAMVRPTSALLVGTSSTNFVLKSGSDRRHEVHGVGAAEIAVHALALLQGRVGDLDRAHHRLSQPVENERKLIDDRRRAA